MPRTVGAVLALALTAGLLALGTAPASAEGTLTVTQQPADTSIVFGEVPDLRVHATGAGPETVGSWWRSIDGGENWSQVTGTVPAVGGGLDVPYGSPITDLASDGARFRVLIYDPEQGSTWSDAALLSVAPGPKVTRHPADASVPPSTQVAFVADAIGVGPITVQWQSSIDGGATWSDLIGKVSGTLPITTNTTMPQDIDYRAVFTGPAGSAASSSAHLRVQKAPAVAVSPASVTRLAGSTQQISSTVTGYPTPTIQWQESGDGGQTWTDIAGAASASYTRTLAEADHGRQVRVVATNRAGTVASAGVPIRVGIAARVTDHPSSQQVADGETVTLRAGGTGTPAPTLRWQRRPPGGIFTDIAGATGTSYSFAFDAVDSGTGYRAVLSNQAGPDRPTSTATITTTGAGSPAIPTILSQPSDFVATSGVTRRFDAVATQATSVQWERSIDGVTWVTVAATTTSTADGRTATSHSPAGLVTASDDGDLYRVRFIGVDGAVTSEPAELTVLPGPGIVADPVDVLASSGNAQFTVTAAGNSALYRWERSVDGGTSWTPASTTSPRSLSLPINGQSVGRVRVVVQTSEGTVTSAEAVHRYGSPPTASISPAAATRAVGETLTLMVTPSGVPVPDIQWQRRPAGDVGWVDLPGEQGSQYTVVAADAMHGDTFRARVTNTWGTSLTAEVPLVVGTAPTSTTPIASQIARDGDTVTFVVPVDGGFPSPDVQWYRDPVGSAPAAAVPGATGVAHSFTFNGSDSGDRYYARLTNRVGSTQSATATVTLGVGASIVTPPTDVTATVPGTATLSAVSSGNPIPGYRWERSLDGGATWCPVTSNSTPASTRATYSFQPSLGLDGARFRVVFENPYGPPVVSNAVTLHVNAIPTITLQPKSTTVAHGATASFTAAATGVPSPGVQWYRSTDQGVTYAAIPGATNPTLTVDATSESSGNWFVARFESAVGSAVSVKAQLRVLPGLEVTVAQPWYAFPQDGRPGAAFTASASAASVPAATISWYRVELVGDPAVLVRTRIGTGATLTHVPEPPSGTVPPWFEVEAQGLYGGTVALLPVGLAVAPTVTSSPVTQIVGDGQSVTFAASATVSTGPEPTVRWQVQASGSGPWTDVPGAVEATLTTTASLAHTGDRYRAVFANLAGEVATNPAVMQVDGKGPVVEPSVSSASSGSFGIYPEAVAVLLRGTDELAGVQSITWSASGAQTVPATTVAGSTVDVPVTAPGITTVSFTATDAVGNVSATGSQVVVIDPRPVVSIAGGTSALEPDASSQRGVYFQVNLSAPAAADVTVSYYTRDVSATGCTSTTGCDYGRSGSALSPQTVKIKPGSTQATLGLSVNPDGLSEADETFEVVVVGVSSNALLSSASTAAATILDADTRSQGGQPILLLTPRNDVVEGDGIATGQVVISLSKPLAVPLTVTYFTFDVTAHAPADYRAVTPTSVTIPAGSLSKTIDVRVYGNHLVDGDRWFGVSHLAASVPPGVELVQPGEPAEVRIIDDDRPL